MGVESKLGVERGYMGSNKISFFLYICVCLEIHMNMMFVNLLEPEVFEKYAFENSKFS